MNLPKIQQVKTQKFFKAGDIAVYALTLCVVLALFWAFVFSAPKIALTKVDFVYTAGKENVVIFTYDFAKDVYTVNPEWTDRVNVDVTDTGYDVTTHTVEGEFNLVRIERTGKVYVADADCSYHKDCTNFAPIISGSQTIICVPHNLQIVGEGATSGDDPVIG